MHSKLVLLLAVGLTACLVSGSGLKYDTTPYHQLFAGAKTSVTDFVQAAEKLFEEPDHFLAEQVYALLSVMPEQLTIGKYKAKDYKELAVLSKERCGQSQLFQRISSMCKATRISLVRKYCQYCDEALKKYCSPTSSS